MGKTTLTGLIAALVGIATLTLAIPAEAGRGKKHGWKGGGNRYVQNNYYNHRHNNYRRRDNGLSAVGAGLLGFGVGAIVGSALTPREVYVAPPPPPTYVGYRPAPWTPDWYSYCYSRYRTFDPNSGTFVGYDGYEHFCR